MALQASDADPPAVSAERLSSKAWSSALSVADFASCVSMGIEPVGFVQGCAVMQWSWYSGAYYANFRMGMVAPGRDQYYETWRCPHGFVGGEHRMYGFNYEQVWVESGWATGWSLAYQRMVEEARELGAHGVIGVVDAVHHIAGTMTAEFTIRGTAVRVPDAPVPKEPFTTFLAGQKLAKLIDAGFVPVSIAAALASVYMCGYCITHYQLAGTSMGAWSGSMSGGIGGITHIDQVIRAQQAAWRLAREHVRKQIGADSLHGATLERSEHEVGEGDLTTQCLLKGNRVRRFKPFDQMAQPTSVVRLK